MDETGDINKHKPFTNLCPFPIFNKMNQEKNRKIIDIEDHFPPVFLSCLWMANEMICKGISCEAEGRHIQEAVSLVEKDHKINIIKI